MYLRALHVFALSQLGDWYDYLKPISLTTI